MVLMAVTFAACQDDEPLGPSLTGVVDIRLAPDAVTFFRLGDVFTFSATPVNAAGEAMQAPVSWRSMNADLVAVDERSGEAVTLDDGTVEIVASSGAVQGRASVVVSASVVNRAWVAELGETDPAPDNDSTSASATVRVN